MFYSEARIAAMLSADEQLRQQHAQTLADIERRHAAQIKELNERLNNSYQVNGDAARALAVAAQVCTLFIMLG
jgi:gas vesicle protein